LGGAPFWRKKGQDYAQLPVGDSDDDEFEPDLVATPNPMAYEPEPEPEPGPPQMYESFEYAVKLWLCRGGMCRGGAWSWEDRWLTYDPNTKEINLYQMEDGAVTARKKTFDRNDPNLRIAYDEQLDPRHLLLQTTTLSGANVERHIVFISQEVRDQFIEAVQTIRDPSFLKIS